MGLGSSKEEARTLTINYADMGGMVISQKAVENIVDPIKEKKKKPASEDDVKKSKEQRTAESAASIKRLQEYESLVVKGFNKSAKEVEELFQTRYNIQPVCGELQQQVQQCYSQNPSECLKCLDIVNKFVKCVEDERQTRVKITTNVGA